MTAADVGKKEASTTNRFGWSQARQKGSRGEVAGSSADANGAALVRRRPTIERSRENDRITRRAQAFLESADEHLVGGPIAPLPVQTDLVAVDRDPAFRIREVLAHRVPVHRAPAYRTERPFRRQADAGLEDGGGDAPEELDVAERRPAVPVIEIKVVDPKSLLIDRVVDDAWIDRHDRRRIVVHEMPTDRVRTIGEAALPGSEQQRR